MLEALAGSLVGGLLALLGARLGIGWQARHRARTLSAALLAELETFQNLDDYGASQRLNRELLGALKEGRAPLDRVAIQGLYDISFVEAAPVYHASLGEIGLLNEDISRSLIAYYASAFFLLRFMRRFLGHDLGLDAEALKAIGVSIEAQYLGMLARRREAIASLRNYLDLPPIEKQE